MSSELLEVTKGEAEMMKHLLQERVNSCNLFLNKHPDRKMCRDVEWQLAIALHLLDKLKTSHMGDA